MEHYKNLSLEDIEGEVWLPIKDYEGLYEVSNLGRVKSLEKSYFAKKGTKNRGKIPTKILSQCLGTAKGKEYCRLALCNGLTFRPKHFSVHRLVASAFIPNPENKPQVNHINGIKTDNREVNLEWNTPSENAKHNYKIGISTPNIDNINVRGAKHGRTKLTEENVYKIRERYDLGEKPMIIWKDYPQTSHSTICGIGLRKSWKYLPEK